ncbi:L-ascorbate metabolism protein UlaG (beta-lactamase superfamily) [Nocardioides luteus]|uniref:MBL fold metallo-hydrolase n=1 Tax=Nocardioides luteus TaxID=1844 RepID=A0ABQ5SSN7_9ACTN|nr:MBL fold metallo-hydrolase [Nocardioides luteus]MDR7313416.1 L-ascorbate metabolism protein UlaG (beta-lactamase superfamily) [Nocardioides luteus]GGR60767.1 MBL fold metallo-hydrolase [Nocardioides luteus]GLJ66482.1 MBL fold metallo-hydrolase [Nocardioides luteus]
MRITKFGHACVRIEHDGAVVVLDPGVFTQPEALDGATAVLITHEHPDHYHPPLLENNDAPIYTIGSVAAQIQKGAPAVHERTTVVKPGDTFDVGLPVTAINEKHAVIHPELPHIDNSGYLIQAGDTKIFHPGDALDGPGQPVDVLFLPVSAPWARSADLIDFAREVGASKTLAIHDRVYSEAGSKTFDTQAGALIPAERGYVRLADGADL